MENFDFNKKLYVITESAISKGKSNEEVVKEAIKGGSEMIQLREKNWDKEQVKEEAIKLLKICKENKVLFILNDYVDIALDIGADGVHLGQSDMSIKAARKISNKKNKNLIIGLSTHSIERAINADKEDVDYITIGPIFKTRAKDYTVGTEIIDKVVNSVKKPVIAIGGININKIDEVLEKGAKSIAVISAVVSADNIEEEARKLVQKIKSF
jgi:thiamine-phosphate pyrophosphorylase